jgi:hypothetical protein
LIVAAALGCQDIAGFAGSPGMNPGQDCLACHGATGQASAQQWSAAGTIFPRPDSASDEGIANAEILIVDSANPPRALTLRSNAAGNFYTAEPLMPPLRVAAQYGGQRYQMQEAAPTGSCNLCHALDPHTVAKPAPLPSPWLDAGFDYGMPPRGRLFVPPAGPIVGPLAGPDGGAT